MPQVGLMHVISISPDMHGTESIMMYLFSTHDVLVTIFALPVTYFALWVISDPHEILFGMKAHFHVSQNHSLYQPVNTAILHEIQIDKISCDYIPDPFF